MRVLGIETSCDESAVALVSGASDSVRIVKNVVASQVMIHRVYGGVVPEVAAREHVRTLPALIRAEGINAEDVDLIAVTIGPGLVTTLRVGIDTARTLSFVWRKPLIGVNHLVGHIAANWIVDDESKSGVLKKNCLPVFPALCLVVSGGHTELLLMQAHDRYERLGETRDDAVGESFDKVAKMIGLPYPGGPEIARRAVLGSSARYIFPRPMMEAGELNFSYSGLKTAVRREVEGRSFSESEINDLAASFEIAAIEPLVVKTERALVRYRNEVKSIVLAGGVAANALLRSEFRKLSERVEIPFFMPRLSLTGDNAAMIAAAGYFARARAALDSWRVLSAIPDWCLGEFT